MVQHILVVEGLLIINALRSHSDKTYSVALLRISDQPDEKHQTKNT
jgi:hypothetical protein